ILKVGSGLITLGGAGAAEVNVEVGGKITVVDFATVLPVGVNLSSTKNAMTVGTKFTGEVIDLTKWAGMENVKNITAKELSKGVSIIGNGIDNSIVGGAGNDTLYGGDDADTLTGSGGNDVFVYSKGDDVIKDYTAGKDSIMMAEDVEITSQKASEKDWVITTNKGNLTIKNGKGATLTIVDSEGNRVSNSEISKLIEDDNFVNDTAQIDSITEITDTNYSAGKITDSASYDNLTNDTLATVYTYTDK
ncbi:MAG: hypothetical protein IKZ58_00035, partial [Selenomonadaceae bacterium]|nr:hypothetical protein [Selenomonadaceae bacterium]